MQILPASDRNVIYRFGTLELDVARYELHDGGVPVSVEPQVFEVLAYLVTHRDRVVTKEELLDNVWGDRFVSESALTSRIKTARRAVGDSGETQQFIRTVHGRGYRFVADVEARSTTATTPSPSPSPPLSLGIHVRAGISMCRASRPRHDRGR